MIHTEVGILMLRCLCIVVPFLADVGGSSDSRRLFDDLLMKGYDNQVRPRPSNKFKGSTIIHFGLRLSQIVSVDEVNQIMTANFWAVQEWVDPRLKWDIKQYNNITMLFVPAEKLWRPDLVLYNNADGDYTITATGKAVIYPNGNVYYTPPMQFKSSCLIDVQYFPFDEQLCNMKFGPWTHDTSKVDVLHFARHDKNSTKREMITDGVTLNDYQQSVEWDIMNATAQENLVGYPCCPGLYFSDVTFFITLRRKHLYYVINLVIPCMSMNILTIMAFYLPSYSGEKIGITISVFISLSLFQLVLFDLTPRSSVALPLIGKYIVVTSCLVSISVMANTMILNMNHRMSSTHEMSNFVRWLFLDILSRLLYMGLPSAQQNCSLIRKNRLSLGRSPKHGSLSEENITTFKSSCSDISTYDNIHLEYDAMASTRPQNQYIGFNMRDWDMDKMCALCHSKRMSGLSPNAHKGFDGLCFIAKHYDIDDAAKRVKDEWRYVALVFDRILLLTYITITLVMTMEIFMNAPALYDNKQPIGHSN